MEIIINLMETKEEEISETLTRIISNKIIAQMNIMDNNKIEDLTDLS